MPASRLAAATLAGFRHKIQHNRASDDRTERALCSLHRNFPAPRRCCRRRRAGRLQEKDTRQCSPPGEPLSASKPTSPKWSRDSQSIARGKPADLPTEEQGISRPLPSQALPLTAWQSPAPRSRSCRETAPMRPERRPLRPGHETWLSLSLSRTNEEHSSFSVPKSSGERGGTRVLDGAGKSLPGVQREVDALRQFRKRRGCRQHEVRDPQGGDETKQDQADHVIFVGAHHGRPLCHGRRRVKTNTDAMTTATAEKTRVSLAETRGFKEAHET